MKRRNGISILLIVICIGVLLGYRAVARIREDSTPPQIHMEDTVPEYSALEPRASLLQGVTARDNRDGDVTDSLVVESVRLLHGDGTAQITYAAFDKAGNVGKQTREVKFHDYVSPRFALSEPLMFSHTSSYDVLNIITATDILDGDITHRIRATVLDDVKDGYAGTHEIQFRVTNSLGEMVELVLPVEIYTPSLFEGSLTLTDYLIYLEKGDSFDAESYLDSFSVGREELQLNGAVPGDMQLKTTGLVQTGVPGVYTVDYQVSRVLGGQTYSGYSRLIVVVEG
jgi:hypothetical protein